MKAGETSVVAAATDVGWLLLGFAIVCALGTAIFCWEEIRATKRPQRAGEEAGWLVMPAILSGACAGLCEWAIRTGDPSAAADGRLLHAGVMIGMSSAAVALASMIAIMLLRGRREGPAKTRRT